MAIYEPIRDGFREFNRMLMDAQSWKEKHAEVQHQREMDHLRLQNGIEQQIFNNQMALKAHQLALKGDARAAQKLTFDIQDSNRKWALNEKATRLGMQNTEESIKNSKLDRLGKINALQKYEKQEAERPILMQKAAEQVFNYDPIEERTAAGEDAINRLNATESELKSTDSWNIPRRGQLKAQRNRIKGEINKIAATLTPDAQVSALRDQADQAMSLSIEFSNNGDTDTAGRLVQKAQMLENRANGIVSAQLKEREATAKGVKPAPGLMTEAQMSNVKAYYESEGIAGGIIGSDPVKPKMRQLGTIITRVHQQQMGGTPETRAIARADVINKVEEFETQYWNMVNKALMMKPSQRKELILALGMQYDPKASNAQQIKNAYYLQFRDAIRGLVEDKEFTVYRPNETTRKMTLGVGLGE